MNAKIKFYLCSVIFEFINFTTMSRRPYTQEDRANDIAFVQWMDSYEAAQKEMGHTPSSFWYSLRNNAAQMAGI